MKIMDKIEDTLARLLLGASAQERNDMIIELAFRRLEKHVVAALEGDEETEVQAPAPTPSRLKD